MPAQCFSRQLMDRRRPCSAGPGVRILSEVGDDRRVPPLQEEGGWPGAGFSVRSDRGGALGQPCTFNRGRCRMDSGLFESNETLFGVRQRASFPKKPLTAAVQEQKVGVEWRVQRGWPFSQAMCRWQLYLAAVQIRILKGFVRACQDLVSSSTPLGRCRRHEFVFPHFGSDRSGQIQAAAALVPSPFATPDASVVTSSKKTS